MGKTYNLKGGVAKSDEIVENLVVASADGAIAIQPGTVVITKATAAALTLGTPTAAQNGTIIRIISATAAAHTVTAATIGFNAGDAAKDVGTFGAAIGNGFTCVAYEGEWLVFYATGVTFA
jgi:hypothetical protein